MKAGYVHFGNLVDSELENRIGTPQGSILSPLLCNILFNKFDLEMERYCELVNVPKKNVVNPEYTKSRSYTDPK